MKPLTHVSVIEFEGIGPGPLCGRILADLALTAEEKYLRFIKSYPDIEQHIKNYHLASYLGITTESLSRVRHELARR